MERRARIDWRVYPLDEKYEVSSEGGVRSVKTGRSRRLFRTSKGYLTVSLAKRKDHRVHRMVAIAFIGPPPSGRHQVNHKNGDPSDNRVENLEWVTSQENIQHAIHVLKRRRCGAYGSKNIRARLNEYQVRVIKRLLASRHTCAEIGVLFNVSLNTIGSIKYGKSWQQIHGSGNASLRDQGEVQKIKQ